jgi:hypothetical protein
VADPRRPALRRSAGSSDALPARPRGHLRLPPLLLRQLGRVAHWQPNGLPGDLQQAQQTHTGQLGCPRHVLFPVGADQHLLALDHLLR